MIYVTVGKMPLGFDRLVKAADALAATIGEDMFIQLGSSAYIPVNAGFKDFLDFDEAEGYLRDASLVVSHAGIGTIIGALRSGTPIVVVPRRERYKEHFNDHQMEVAEAIEGRPGVRVVYEITDLRAAVDAMRGLKGSIAPGRPGDGIIKAVDEFLSGA
jgi:beta-1,4-N-acetylglucosaminyltransferase